MWTSVASLFLLIFSSSNFVHYSDAMVENQDVDIYRRNVEKWIDELERSLQEFNSISALLTWELYINPSSKKSQQAVGVGIVRNNWKNQACASKVNLKILTYEQQRKLYLLCRGPRFSNDMALEYLHKLGKLQQIFNSEICISDKEPDPIQSLSYDDQNATDYNLRGQCVHGEPDLERLIKRSELNVDQLKWIWKTWHDTVGLQMRKTYPNLIKIENIAAQNNGYRDMGEIWKEELEVPDLEDLVFNLYEEIKPLYVMLHAVVRHKLLVKYGALEVNPLGPIPIHLLGNMWGQDWSSLIELFVTPNDLLDLDKRIQNKKWNVKDMVLQAEDMYMSLGLPKMTDQFWKYSIFEEAKNRTICHGTAAHMYSNNDYRILMCGKIDMENLYIIHHEMGHIQYFMAYKNVSPIFQDGANSALHESIGDAVMNGVMAPQHLHRLGLLDDAELSNKNVDHFLLLKQALTRIPEIPYSLILDKYRWDIFNGKISEENYNKIYWELNERIRGIVPPERRGEEFFDPGAKFHVPDNTPYIRYFLSSILQMEIYKGLCELSLYGTHPGANSFRDMNLFVPLHRCDIYGSKKCGKHLLAMMSKGSSIHWPQALQILTGKSYITTKPLLEYYLPIYKWLQLYVEKHNVPVGW